jgi:hypothetical protein
VVPVLMPLSSISPSVAFFGPGPLSSASKTTLTEQLPWLGMVCCKAQESCEIE